MKDRSRGALIGLAVGDALGAAVEFKSPGTFAPVSGYRNGGPHRLEAGRPGALVMLCGLEVGRLKSGDRLAVWITSIDAEHRKVSVGLMP
jgi:hypothetical protein